jgi:predicted Zn-dependent protease
MVVNKTEQRLTEIVIDSVTYCDKCSKEIKSIYFDAFKCTIELVEGEIYQDSGRYTKKSIDLCKSCATNLFSGLKATGYRINETKRDY